MSATVVRTAAHEQAERVLGHYLRTVWEKAGLRWDRDNDSEVSLIVDLLVECAKEAVERHEENSPHLYADGSS